MDGGRNFINRPQPEIPEIILLTAPPNDKKSFISRVTKDFLIRLKFEWAQAACVSLYVRVQTLKLSPQPHSLEALGLLN